MPTPKILVLPGSTRAGSRQRQAGGAGGKGDAARRRRHAHFARRLQLLIEVSSAKAGAPFNAIKLKQMIMAHRGVFI